MKKLVFAVLFVVFNVQAEWALNSEQSSLTFVSVKQEHIAEVHSIPSLSGNISADGAVTVNLDLASIESGIPIRNQRMKEMLFDVANFRSASFSMSIPNLNDIAESTSNLNASGLVELHGVTQEIALEYNMSLDKNKIVATLTKPILVNASQFKLTEGIDALKKVAGLTSIGYTVPVYATLVFEKK